jgi:hypothetical protein
MAAAIMAGQAGVQGASGLIAMWTRVCLSAEAAKRLRGISEKERSVAEYVQENGSGC